MSSRLVILILVFLWSTFAAHAKPPCAGLFSDGTVAFGDVYDKYMEGTPPDFARLRGKRWVLKGVASHATSTFFLDSAHESAGYRVNGVVPEISFKSRADLAQEGFASLLSWAPTDDFVVRENWGAAFADLQPELAFRINWIEAPAEKSQAVGFSLPLYNPGEGGPKLFMRLCEKDPTAGSRVFFQCRWRDPALICMAELARERETDGRRRPACISDFLWFERG